jgi:uncharacterized membrane protein
LADIFTKSIDSSRFAALQGELVFVILMAWFEGRVGVLSYILVSFAFLLHFLHTHLSHFASPVLLACICLITLNHYARMSSNEMWTFLLDHAR